MSIHQTFPALGSSYVRVLSIAGSDSGGGAGVQADLKTFAAMGCYGMSAITAITAQNTVGVRAMHAVPEGMLKSQIQAVVEDIGVDAVKIGMLPSAELVRVVAWAIEHYQLSLVVLDPVMVASSGAALMEPACVAAMVAELFPWVSLITPNLNEAAVLLGYPVERADEMEAAANALLGLGAPAVLLKGGHVQGERVIDVLAQGGESLQRWEAQRIHSANLHGTGCTLASAIAANLALGCSLVPAVSQARDFVLQAIAHGAGVQTGHGQGPLNHGHAPLAMRLRPA